MDTEQAVIEITSAIVHLERLSEECAANQHYALHYCLRDIQRKLLVAETNLKSANSGSTDNN